MNGRNIMRRVLQRLYGGPPWLLVLLILLSSPPASIGAPQVLIIHSYHQTFPWTESVGAGMLEVLQAEAPGAEIHVEYLDAKRYSPLSVAPAFTQLLENKYRDEPISVILTSDDAAYQVMLPLREKLFPGIPLVFCGVNNFSDDQIEGVPAITGVVEDFDLAATLDIALKLQPGINTVVVISDATETGRLNLERFHQIKPHYLRRFDRIIELAGQSEAELRQALASLPREGAIILLLSFYRDREGTAFSVEEMNALISGITDVPVYSAWDFVMGSSVVGGYMVSGHQQGRAAGRLAARILDGTRPEDIPIIRKSPNLYLFDYRQLVRHNIDPGLLPEGSVIINEPQPNALIRYGWLIGLLAVFALAETVLVLALMKTIRRSRQTQEALRTSEERFRLAMRAATDGIFDWKIGTDEIYYSPAWKAMLGFRDDEIESSFSVWERLTDPEGLKRAWAVLDEHLSGQRERFETEFKMRHKDGHWVDILARADTILDENGKPLRLVGTHVDISERKRVEEALERERSFLEAVFNTIEDAIVICDANGALIRFNDAARRMHGITEQSIDPKQWPETYDLYQPDGVTPMAYQDVPLYRALRGEQVHNAEMVVAGKTGQRVHLECGGRVLNDESGRIIGAVVAMHDITERKRVESALRQSEERYRLLYLNTPVMLHSIDASGRLLTVSNRWLEKMGYEEHEVLGRKSTDFLTEEARRYATEVTIPEFFRTGTIKDVPYQMVTRDGQILDVLMSAISEKDERGMVIRSMAVIDDVTERKRAEEALRASEEKYRYMFENIQDTVYSVTPDGVILDVSPSIHELSRGLYSPDDLVGRSLLDLYADPSNRQAFLEELGSKGKVSDYQINLRNRDGSVVVCSVSARLQQDEEGKPIKIIGNIRDISDRVALEKQLLQAQKMESIGRLAGGVAHDFNNMLGVILGYAELLLEELAQDTPHRQALLEIQSAAQRSAELTGQLLAFARRQTVVPRVLNLNKTVQGMLNMLRRLIGEDISLVWHPGDDLHPVKIDPSQVDQILANLCVNARDAITGNGTIRIATRNASIDSAAAATHPDGAVGSYVVLSVADDGCGIPAADLLQVFEPFFTTKQLGEGTGLGLATVYGIVKQNNGFIEVQSDPGHGTIFELYLPCHDQLADTGESEVAEPALRGTETIVVVEDESMILEMTSKLLRRLGYRVIPVATPVEIIRNLSEIKYKIDLLLTDVIMPEMNGKDLAAQLRRRYPDLRCLYMSGYTADIIAHHGVLDEGVQFLQKPFSTRALATSVRACLDGRQENG